MAQTTTPDRVWGDAYELYMRLKRLAASREFETWTQADCERIADQLSDTERKSAELRGALIGRPVSSPITDQDKRALGAALGLLLDSPPGQHNPEAIEDLAERLGVEVAGLAVAPAPETPRAF